MVVPKNLMVPTLWPTTNTLSPRFSPPPLAVFATQVAEEFKPVWLAEGKWGKGKGVRQRRENEKGNMGKTQLNK